MTMQIWRSPVQPTLADIGGTNFHRSQHFTMFTPFAKFEALTAVKIEVEVF
jgi:hypothetical protein